MFGVEGVNLWNNFAFWPKDCRKFDILSCFNNHANDPFYLFENEEKSRFSFNFNIKILD